MRKMSVNLTDEVPDSAASPVTAWRAPARHKHQFISNILGKMNISLLKLLPPTSRCTTRQRISYATPDEIVELVKNPRIPPAFRYLFLHNLKCIGDRRGFLVRTVGGQGIENIHRLHDLGGCRNRVSAQPIRVPRAVMLLVVVPDDGKH